MHERLLLQTSEHLQSVRIPPLAARQRVSAIYIALHESADIYVAEKIANTPARRPPALRVSAYTAYEGTHI
jgi:hypothetical protein